MDTAAEIEEREDNDGNSAFYNTRTQIWGWTREEVDRQLQGIMSRIYTESAAAASEYGFGNDLLHGSNIAGFLKVARAMLSQGIT